MFGLIANSGGFSKLGPTGSSFAARPNKGMFGLLMLTL
jgi:hypothetical protein